MSSGQCNLRGFRSLLPWISLAVLNVCLRGWRVNDWLLPNVDEIVLMSTMEQGFLSGCSASSAYWPAHWVLRSFFFLSEWHHYRVVGVLFGVVFILVMYATARRLVSGTAAWVFACALSFQWYFLYMSRIIEIATFIPACIAACLYCFVRWMETRRPRFVYCLFAVGGVAASTWSPPFFYLLGALGIWFAAAAIGRQIAWKHFLGSLGLACVIMVPYLVVVLWRTDVQADVLARFTFSGAASDGVLAPNLVHVAIPLKTWTHLATFHHEQLPWKALSAVALLPLLIPFALARFAWQSSVLQGMLIIAALQILLMSVSPVPIYIEGHVGPLYLTLLLVLLGLGAGSHPPLCRRIAGGVLAVTLVLSVGFAPYYLESQQGRVAEWLQRRVVDTGEPVLAVSMGGSLKLGKVPAIRNLPIELDVFPCDGGVEFWSKRSPGDYPYIISTFDCWMEADLQGKGYRLVAEMTLRNLYESNLRDGLTIWRVERMGEDVAYGLGARVGPPRGLDRRPEGAVEAKAPGRAKEHEGVGIGAEAGVTDDAGKTDEREICAGEMVPVPGGSFMMGCNTAVDTECIDREHPYHQVHVPAFEIDRCPVSVALYEECVDAGGCTSPAGGGRCNFGMAARKRHPVNCVTWHQARAYCEWSGKRLCTESEWEKAARGTDGRKYPWGNQAASCDHAVFASGGFGCGRGHTSPVGSRPLGAGPYGTLDMAGNVWEWVEDDWHADYQGAPRDGSAWVNEPRAFARVGRGGGFNYGERLLRASYRGPGNPDMGNEGMGLRCCRSLLE